MWADFSQVNDILLDFLAHITVTYIYKIYVYLVRRQRGLTWFLTYVFVPFH